MPIITANNRVLVPRQLRFADLFPEILSGREPSRERYQNFMSPSLLGMLLDIETALVWDVIR